LAGQNGIESRQIVKMRGIKMSEIYHHNIKIGDVEYDICSDDDYLSGLGVQFEPSMVDLFKSLVKKSDVVADIGANIGCTALLFSQISSAVHAFEPCLTTYSILEQNVNRAGVENVWVYDHGLGEELGEFTITYGSWNRSGAYVSNVTQASVGHTSEKIRISTLDHFSESKGVAFDFLKIDVEGFEASVIRGGSNAIAKDKPVVALELNHWCLNALQRITVPDFFDFLRSVFPILYAVENQGYFNLHNEDDSFGAMYQHINASKFNTLVGAFDEGQLGQFYAEYKHGFYP
jgi:FkbM family methyltransferase